MSEAVEASLCYFFENWLMKHKSPNLLKPLGTIIYQNYQFYYPSEPFSFHHFNVRHPVFDILPIWFFLLLLIHPKFKRRTLLNIKCQICIKFVRSSSNFAEGLEGTPFKVYNPRAWNSTIDNALVFTIQFGLVLASDKKPIFVLITQHESGLFPVLLSSPRKIDFIGCHTSLHDAHSMFYRKYEYFRLVL